MSSPRNTRLVGVRILTGTMAISARIDILKLRYFWKLMQAGDGKIAHVVYKQHRLRLLERAVGYIQELFNNDANMEV